jgi:hypothetical protein
VNDAIAARKWHTVADNGLFAATLGALHLSDRGSSFAFPSCRKRRRLRPEPVDPLQDLVEQPARHGDLSQLKHDVPSMSHDPGTDLHKLLTERRQ